jgi:hypothetical protein
MWEACFSILWEKSTSPIWSNTANNLRYLAPIVNDMDVKYNIVSSTGSLLRESIFRQDASPEVDAAWDSLGVNCVSFLSSNND